MTPDISKLVNQVTRIRQWLESAGQTSDGLATLSEIRTLRSDLIIAITHIDLCARSLDMALTMAVNPTPSPNNPTSPQRPSRISSPNTFELCQATSNGKITSTTSLDQLAT